MSDESTKRIPKPLAIALTVVVVLAVTLAAFAVTSNIVQPKNNSPEQGYIEAKANGILGEPSNTIDVVFLGDSSVMATFSPLQMWNEQGFTSYVCSTNGQQMHYGNSLLHRALSDQSPKIVVLETNTFYTHFSIGDIMIRTAQDLFPVVEYHDRWKHLTPEDFYAPVNYTWTDHLKGQKYLYGTDPGDEDFEMEASSSEQEFSALSEVLLNMMIDYCRDHGATPVIMTAPSTTNWNMAKHNYIVDYAEQKGIDYYDLSQMDEAIGIDWETDTLDRGDHLNIYGATKASRFVGELLVKEYDLPDHRSDEAYYPSWNKAYEGYLRVQDERKSGV